MLASWSSRPAGRHQLLRADANVDNLSDRLHTAGGWRTGFLPPMREALRHHRVIAAGPAQQPDRLGITIGSVVLPKVAELSKEFTAFLGDGPWP